MKIIAVPRLSWMRGGSRESRAGLEADRSKSACLGLLGGELRSMVGAVEG